MSMLAHALNYAEAGYRIFPCHYPILTKNSTPACSCNAPASKPCKIGKHPMIRDWPSLASSDPDQVKKWWTTRPDSNIGMLTGAPNGFDVLDEDPKDNGDLALLERTTRYGELPPTPRSRTGSGGEHIFFKHHPGLKNNNHGKIAKGLDFRTTGGQIIAPPSLHASGQRYEWETPLTTTLADPPDWLLEIMREDEAVLSGTRQRISPDEWARIAYGVTGGDRHNALIRLAGLLFNTLPSPHLAAALIHAYNQALCDAPKDDDEVNKIINFVLRRRLRKLN